MGSVLFAAVFVALQFATGMANPDSKRLYDDLLSNYNRLIRPVGNNSDRLTVKMGLRLSQLIDVVSTHLVATNHHHPHIRIPANPVQSISMQLPVHLFYFQFVLLQCHVPHTHTTTIIHHSRSQQS